MKLSNWTVKLPLQLEYSEKGKAAVLVTEVIYIVPLNHFVSHPMARMWCNALSLLRCMEKLWNTCWRVPQCSENIIPSNDLISFFLFLTLVFVRAGGWRGGPGAHLRCDAGGKLPVDDEAKCRGGEHGENWVTPEKTRLTHTTEMRKNLSSLQMTSVERVMEYTELKSEAPWTTQKHPAPHWPDKGLVTFNHVNFSYGDDGLLVLKDINATFQPHEKVRGVGLHTATACLSTCTMYNKECVCVCVSPVSGWYCWSDRCWEKLSGLSSVPPGRASGEDLHRWCSDLRDRPPWPAPEDVHHPTGKHETTST